MDIGTFLVLALIIGLAVKSYFYLKRDFFTFIAALAVSFFALFLYVCLLSLFTFQQQNALRNFLSCLAIFASYQYLILDGIARIAQKCYEGAISPKLKVDQNIRKWFPEQQSHNRPKPFYDLLKNCTYLHLVAIYVISLVSSQSIDPELVSSSQSIDSEKLLELDQLLAVIGTWFLFDTFVDKQKDLLKDVNRQH